MMSRKAPRARTTRAMNALASDPPVAGRVPGSVVAAALVGATAALVGATVALVGVVGAVVGVERRRGGRRCRPLRRMAKLAKSSTISWPPDGPPSACTLPTFGAALAATLMVTVRVCAPPLPDVQSQRTRVFSRRKTQPVNPGVFVPSARLARPDHKAVEVDGDLQRAQAWSVAGTLQLPARCRPAWCSSGRRSLWLTARALLVPQLVRRHRQPGRARGRTAQQVDVAQDESTEACGPGKQVRCLASLIFSPPGTRRSLR